jgi:hypothetical protein
MSIDPRGSAGSGGDTNAPAAPPVPSPFTWWLDRRRRKRQDPNPLAKGEPYRRPPLWQRVFSLVALLAIAVVCGLILTAAIVLVVAAFALALQSAIGS